MQASHAATGGRHDVDPGRFPCSFTFPDSSDVTQKFNPRYVIVSFVAVHLENSDPLFLIIDNLKSHHVPKHAWACLVDDHCVSPGLNRRLWMLAHWRTGRFASLLHSTPYSRCFALGRSIDLTYLNKAQ